MREARGGAAAWVVCRRHPLPALFAGAAVAVCRLTTPASAAPALSALCASGLPGYSAQDGAAFCAAAATLHPRHQLPFVLSRVAASTAIAALPLSREARRPVPGDETAIVFTGGREAAPQLHRCRLSISHEDVAAASVAWPALPPSPGVSHDHVERNVRGTTTLSSAAAPRGTRGDFEYAVDVASVAEVHRVRRRFPHLGRRWMPQCSTEAPAEAIRRALVGMEQRPSRGEAGASDDGVVYSGAALRRRSGWWRHMPTPCASEAEAYASVVLAQHWGARECAVKLVGIAGRSFAYGCVRGAAALGCREECSAGSADEVRPFTGSFLAPGALHLAAVDGAEATALAERGLQPCFYLHTWTEWAPLSDAVDLPYIVVLACAPRRTCLQ
ncbi:hypothetical protein NESM_000013300 [Novymonas esmeraldas]|uniref:Uncharacterized protein n=1 Tax=Novymonas esmeraldas TaxID=1808958 RepID=A0AAW0F0E8_9TRYP